MSNIVKCSSKWLQKVNQLSETEEKLLMKAICNNNKTNLPPQLLELYNMFIKENEVKNEKK